MNIVINTPNSNIGRVLTQRLLASGDHKVTVISRDPSKIADLQGAIVAKGSFEDAATLKAAFEGADTLFWLTPPNYRPDFEAWAQDAATLAASAAKAAGIDRVVVLSSVGAQHAEGNGPVDALHRVEGVFTRAGFSSVGIMRPANFMENLFFSADTIKNASAVFGPTPGDIKVPWVATRDIGARAAQIIEDTSWSGVKHFGVHGPADVSWDEVVAHLSHVLGRQIAYVQVGLEDVRAGMLEAGMPEFVADMFVELYDGGLKGTMAAAEPRDASTTTPTTVQTFIDDTFVDAVR